MSIAWDENQVPALAQFVQENLPLTKGTLLICLGDVPEQCFAGSVDLGEKRFTLLTGMDMTLYEISINVILAYSIALAYDRNEWSGLPSLELLFEAHRMVCESMMDINEDFSVALEDYSDIISTWHSAQGENYGGEGNIEEVLEELGGLLFSNPDDSSKDYGAN